MCIALRTELGVRGDVRTCCSGQMQVSAEPAPVRWQITNESRFSIISGVLFRVPSIAADDIPRTVHGELFRLQLLLCEQARFRSKFVR